MKLWMENVQLETGHIVGAPLLWIIIYTLGNNYMPDTVLVILRTTLEVCPLTPKVGKETEARKIK